MPHAWQFTIQNSTFRIPSRPSFPRNPFFPINSVQTRSSRTFRQKKIPNSLSLLLALGAGFLLLTATRKLAHSRSDAADSAGSTADNGSRIAGNLEASASADKEDEPNPDDSQVARTFSGEDLARQTVFRLILDEGACRMDAIEEVTGDFRQRRRSWLTHAGMIACRLIGHDGVLVDEKLVHAPDHVCAVLEPNHSTDAPKMVLLSGIGPQVFQVRFPATFSAEKLEVHRITQVKPQIVRTLLLTVPLNP